jgi:biopolymer transport protein ExbB/TolQ
MLAIAEALLLISAVGLAAAIILMVGECLRVQRLGNRAED